jgi:periodic tryptophan protein 2
VCYTADGSCILGGGRTKYICLYEISQKILLKQFQISHNRSLDGVQNKVHSDKIVKGVAGTGDRLLDDLDVSGDDSEDEEIGRGLTSHANLPGAKRGKDKGKRHVKPEVRSKCVQISPTGQAWAAATTEGMLIFSLDNIHLFDPVNLDETVTPETTRQCAVTGNHGKALLMALHLGENYLIKEVFQNVPIDEILLVSRSVPIAYIPRLLEVVSQSLEESRNLEHLLLWVQGILSTHSDHLRAASSSSASSQLYMQSFRHLQKVIGIHEKDLTSLCEGNLYTMDYLCSIGGSKENSSSSSSKTV